MSTWKAEYLDRVTDKFLDLEEHDRTVRCIVAYQYNFDVQRLVATINRLLVEMPILNSTFQEDNGKFYWNSRDGKYDNIYNDWKDWTNFFSDYAANFAPNLDPQIKIMTYGNLLAFRVNNMLMDIYGLKQLILYFCDLYNHLENSGYKSPYRNAADRSLKALLSHIPFFHKTGKSKLDKLSNSGFNTAEIPHKENIANASPYLNSDGYYQDEAQKLFELSNKHGTTVSNIFLAAYHRTMATILKQFGKPLNIGRQFDAREETANFRPYNNAHVFLPSSIVVNENDKFADTLKAVTQIQDYINEHHLVAKKISLASGKIFGATEYLQFVSMGDIKKSSLSLGNNVTTEIFFATPSRFLPYLSLAICALEDTEIYLSAVSWCNAEDLPNVKYIFDWIKYEVRTFIHTEYPDFYKSYNETNAKNSTYNPNTQSAPASPVVAPIAANTKGKKLTKAQQKALALANKKAAADNKKMSDVNVGTQAAGKITKIAAPKEIAAPKGVWSLAQVDLAKKYEELTGSKLESDGSGKVKYKIKGKNTYQKRTWAEIQKFVDFKAKSTASVSATGFGATPTSTPAATQKPNVVPPAAKKTATTSKVKSSNTKKPVVKSKVVSKKPTAKKKK